MNANDHNIEAQLTRPAASWLRTCWLIVGLFIVLMLLPNGRVSAQVPRVHALNISGVISPLTADQVSRVLNDAIKENAAALLIQINSSGGSEATIQRITQSLLASPVPVIVYVGGSPEPEALSGAMLITIAGNVAAMQPDARIGLVLPPALSDAAGQPEREERINRMLQIANGAAAARERDIDAIMEIVQDEKILTGDEALDAEIIDQVSPDLATLLSRLDGTEVRTLTGVTALTTQNARLIWSSKTWREQVLQAITDPNVAYVLVSMGIVLMIIELYNPGRLLAGIPGIICLAAAFIAFGNLPISWLGLGLMILAAILFIRELYTPKLTFLGPLGIACYIAGSLVLYRPVFQRSTLAATVTVNIWVMLVTLATLALALLLMKRAIFRVRAGAASEVVSSLVGRDGIVVEPLNPRGVVRVLGQEWSAESIGHPLDTGMHVRVEDVSAGILRVAPDDQADHARDVNNTQLSETSSNP